MMRMKREEENMRKLHNINIVQLYGSLLVPDDLAGQRLLLVMEACHGNLRKLCDRQLQEEEMVYLMLQTLNGLGFMHQHNIIHRY